MKRILLTLILLAPMITFAHELEGNASWYGGMFVGKETANGEIFDTELLTAAHKTLPFNTIVEVTNLDNGLKTEVRINDRGPFIEGRVIDLSKKAATELNMLNTGTARVSIEIIEMPTPPQVMDIQVAAYSNFTYAASMKKTLVSAGFTPKTSMSNNGIMRIIISDVPITKSYEIVKKLEKMGIDKILIKHKG